MTNETKIKLYGTTSATPTRASARECLGGNWFVCVDKFIFGIKLNPIQAMKSFSMENEAIAFARSFNPDKLSIERIDKKDSGTSRVNTDWRGGYIAD